MIFMMFCNYYPGFPFGVFHSKINQVYSECPNEKIPWKIRSGYTTLISFNNQLIVLPLFFCSLVILYIVAQGEF